MIDRERSAIAVVLLMGVAASGKTTIGALLAGLLGWPFADADTFHPPANVQKMASGTPLTDADRWPWLRAIAQWIDEHRVPGAHGVVTCSALRRRYRDMLIGNRDDVALVYLKGAQSVIAQRMVTRHGHFMPTALLQSQFDTLEEPHADERALIVSVDAAPTEIADEIATALRLRG